MNAAIVRPATVDRGIVLVGLTTLSEGIVADSKPRKAHNVNAAVVVMASKFDKLLMFNGEKWLLLKYTNPNVPNRSKGRIFRIVVMIEPI